MKYLANIFSCLMHLFCSERLVVRVSQEQDIDGLKAFYKMNRSGFILPRPEKEIEVAITTGQYFILEEQNSRQIVASAAIFYYDEKIQNLVELSDTLVVEKYRGLGIQKILTRIRIAYMIATHSGSAQITTAINSNNSISLHNQLKAGFIKWKAHKAVYSSCSTCPKKPADRKCCCEYFELPNSAILVNLSRALSDSERPSKYIGKCTFLRFDLRFLEGEIREDLKEYLNSMS